MLDSRYILSMNLKYYRKIYNLSQEKFAETLETSLIYLNQIENCHRKPSIDMLDKIANNLNSFDKNLHITASKLIEYDKKHLTAYI